MQITYRKLPTWKYQLLEDWKTQTNVTSHFIETDFFTLEDDGTLMVDRGYCWDGPSGPTFDTNNFMRGSVVHDVLYQAIRLGELEPHWREQADRELIKLCKEDGMSWLRRKYIYRTLRLFGEGAAKAQKAEELIAP